MTRSTAIRRTKLSVPMRYLWTWHLTPNDTIMDWGCGRGDDVKFLLKQGLVAGGYDPYQTPKARGIIHSCYDWVTSIYVLNTVKSVDERRLIIREMWDHVRHKGHLFVATRTEKEITRLAKDKWAKDGDGWRTGSGTFQKGFTSRELSKDTYGPYMSFPAESKTVVTKGDKTFSYVIYRKG